MVAQLLGYCVYALLSDVHIWRVRADGRVLCLCVWAPGLPLFSSNGGQVVMAEIDHTDGLAQPPRREQKLRQHETAGMSGKSELSQAGGKSNVEKGNGLASALTED